MALKYIQKFVYKIHNRAKMAIKKNKINKAQKYINNRYIGPMEAMWKLNLFPL